LLNPLTALGRTWQSQYGACLYRLPCSQKKLSETAAKTLSAAEIMQQILNAKSVISESLDQNSVQSSPAIYSADCDGPACRDKAVWLAVNKKILSYKEQVGTGQRGAPGLTKPSNLITKPRSATTYSS
jgi:hypothetical protein